MKYLALLGLFLTMSTYAQKTYFVDNFSGKDTNNGTSMYAPWKTIERVNQMILKAGDSTLYQNNIFVARGKGCYFEPGKSTRNIFHANLYHETINNQPPDPEGINANPLFVGEEGQLGANPWLRFLLQGNSPAIDSGLPIEKNGGNDFLGKVLDLKPDRGPFEYR